MDRRARTRKKDNQDTAVVARLQRLETLVHMLLIAVAAVQATINPQQALQASNLVGAEPGSKRRRPRITKENSQDTAIVARLERLESFVHMLVMAALGVLASIIAALFTALIALIIVLAA